MNTMGFIIDTANPVYEHLFITMASGCYRSMKPYIEDCDQSTYYECKLCGTSYCIAHVKYHMCNCYCSYCNHTYCEKMFWENGNCVNCPHDERKL